MGVPVKKNRIATILIVAVLLIVLIAVFFPQSEKGCMERVLRKDSVTSENASSVADVVRNMRAINLDGCPQNFRSAYVRHINAWEDLSELETRVQAHQEYGSSWNMAVDAFVQGFMGNPLGVANEHSQREQMLAAQYAEIQQEMKMTYREVESIAVAAGCSLPSRQ